jgi:hypothetical protein
MACSLRTLATFDVWLPVLFIYSLLAFSAGLRKPASREPFFSESLAFVSLVRIHEKNCCICDSCSATWLPALYFYFSSGCGSIPSRHTDSSCRFVDRRRSNFYHWNRQFWHNAYGKAWSQIGKKQHLPHCQAPHVPFTFTCGASPFTRLLSLVEIGGGHAVGS